MEGGDIIEKLVESGGGGGFWGCRPGAMSAADGQRGYNTSDLM